jgi:molybdopterin/thiamine biosynthesis adenylyltransferase
MDKLDQKINEGIQKKFDIKPKIFDLSKSLQAHELEELFSENKIQRVSDDYEEQHLELFAVKNPTKVYTPSFKQEFQIYYSQLQEKVPLNKQGNWVYFSWSSTLVHILSEEDFQLVRTARNKNLINKDEQEKFYNSTIGIGGLSVGSSVAFALALQGGAKHIKLADMDRMALSNTNRILTGVDNLGVLKIEMAARKIYEINPYAIVDIFPQGITEDSIESFFLGLDVVIDELDNLAVKYLIREHAKKNKIPVVMAADNGDNAVVDVERYDLNQNTPFFHGRMGDVSYEMLKNLDKFGIGKMITKHVGAENVTERMQQSLVEMGKTIVSWPQLGGAALINGAAVAYCIRKILNKQPLESNRVLVNIDSLFIPEYNNLENIDYRKNVADNFKKGFGL